ncbi:MAG: DNA primase [Chloroflexota bacterium]
MSGQNLIEEIKSRIDIVDVVADFVELKKAGQNYKGLCPFHAEKTPSFMVNPSRQMFHCFGCHKGGDVVTFVMDHEHMTFQESLAYLSQRAGIRIEDYEGRPRPQQAQKESLFRIQSEALNFFARTLSKSDRAVRYIQERGVSDETRERFALGYNGSARDSLLQHLSAMGYPAALIRQCGLVHGEDRSMHDFFRDRIIFPIFDLQDRPVAFGGRILTAIKNAPKYLNSPDSPIFRKGETLYALDKARHAIGQKGYAVVVEGYLDALVCHQFGFTNTVAPLGTALTSGHLKKLKRFTDKVLLVFDGDAAGRTATNRSLELVFAEGMIAKIMLLPEGEDPDSLLRHRGAEEFRKRTGAAVTPVSFVFRTYGRRKLDAARSVLSFLTVCSDPLLREDTLRELADASKINEGALREELLSMTRKKPKDRPAAARMGPDREAGESEKPHEEEKILLSIALTVHEKAVPILDRLTLSHIEHPLIRSIFEKMEQTVRESPPGKGPLHGLLSLCTVEEQRLIASLTMNPAIDPDSVNENIEDCLRKMALRRLEAEIALAEDTGDGNRLRTLLSEKGRFVLRKGGP